MTITSSPASQPVLTGISLQAAQSSSLSQAEQSQKKEGARAVSEAEELLLREIGICSPAAEEKPTDAVILLTDDENEGLNKRLRHYPESDVRGVPDELQVSAPPTTGRTDPATKLSNEEESADTDKENCIEQAQKLLANHNQQAMQSTPDLLQTPQAMSQPAQAAAAISEAAHQVPSMQTPQASSLVEEGAPAAEGSVQQANAFQTPGSTPQQEKGKPAVLAKAQRQESIRLIEPSSHAEWSTEWMSQQAAHFRAVSAAIAKNVEQVQPLQPLPGQALKTLSKTEVSLQTHLYILMSLEVSKEMAIHKLIRGNVDVKFIPQ